MAVELGNCQKPTAKSRKALKKFKYDPTHSTPRTTLWARVKDLPRVCLAIPCSRNVRLWHTGGV
jgi:hypothetical protein